MGRGRSSWKTTETTPAGKKKRSDDSPKPSKKKSSSKPTSDDLRSLDDKWSQMFARLEAMLLAKFFTVPVEPVKKPNAVVTSPFLIWSWYYPFLLSASEFLSNLLFSYHLLYFCTALFLIIILSSNHLHKSKTLSQLTQCPFTGTLLSFDPGAGTSMMSVTQPPEVFTGACPV